MKAYGKINLFLDILSKREDGYHNIASIMQTISLHDEITVSLQKEGITIVSDHPFVPNNEKNIAYKAARLILDKYNVKDGVKIDIDKKIPVTAGLAGGSTDAASVLVQLNDLLGLNIPELELLELGKSLGADIPFCIKKGTFLAEGIGEDLTELPKPDDYYIILIDPTKIFVSTKWAYSHITPDMWNKGNSDFIEDYIKEKDSSILTRNTYNIFEKPVFKNYPHLKEIKETLNSFDPDATLMSGSGATIFALFKDYDKFTYTIDNLALKDCKIIRASTVYN